jgi:hypothetical protein
MEVVGGDQERHVGTAKVDRPPAVPFRGRSPVKLMAKRGGEGMGDVLQFLNRAVLRRYRRHPDRVCS